MSDVQQMETVRAESAGALAVRDRRRPGRLSYVNPELVPLLRGTALPAPQPEQVFGDPDQLRSVRGIPLAIAASAGIWAAIAYAGHLILS